MFFRIILHTTFELWSKVPDETLNGPCKSLTKSWKWSVDVPIDGKEFTYHKLNVPQLASSTLEAYQSPSPVPDPFQNAP